MIKKILILLAVIAGTAWGASAQHAPGSWRIVPMKGTTFTRLYDTPEKVYYLTGGSLYSYDKEGQETTYFSPGENISNYGVSQLYYNPAGRYMMVTFSDSSFDLLYDDGGLVHMPDISNSNLLTTKAIRHAAFAKDRIYVGTDFGMVVFDDKDHHVIESGYYDYPVTKIAIVGDHILALMNGKLYSAPVAGRHKDMSSFTELTAPASIVDMMGSESNDFPYVVNGNVYKGTFSPETNTVTGELLRTQAGATALYPSAAGWVSFATAGMVEVDKDFNVTYTAYPADVKNNQLSAWKGAKALWAASADGVGSYDISGETPTVLSERYWPEGALMFAAAHYAPSPDGEVLYIGNTGHARGYSGATSNSGTTYVQAYNWKDGTFTNKSPKAATGNTNKGPVQTLVNPFDPTVLITGTTQAGIYVHREGEILATVGESQIPVDRTWMPWIMDIALDADNNLWLGDRNNSLSADYYILPAEKVKTLATDGASITKSDWLKAKMPDTYGDDYRYFLTFATRKNKNKAIHIRDYSSAIVTYDTRGTLTTDDDVSALSTGMRTQDGNLLKFEFYLCMTEDLEGNIWIGTSEGVLIVKDVEQFGTASPLEVIRPKVSRNDGTVYADYLLSTDKINYIAVDPNNRKWIATEASGLFLVSADGTEILENFTTDNSPLVSNNVYSVYCSPDGNDVLLSTPSGFMVYSGTSSPAAADYSDVFAYPNPVRPDYQGWITIQGLMDNSLVKIADSQGSVVAQGRSEGGMFVWDGCNSVGERVRSGVYLVLASQYDGSNSSGVVTKIVVIN